MVWLQSAVRSGDADLGLVWTTAAVLDPDNARPPTAQSACITWCLPIGYRTPPLWRYLVR